MGDRYRVTIERESGSSGCVSIMIGAVIFVTIVLLFFVISPLVIGVWLIISLFQSGWRKESQILTAVWVAICLLVPTIYYLGLISFLNQYFSWLDQIIWIYYVFAVIGIAAVLFWGAYKIAVAIAVYGSEQSDSNQRSVKGIIIGVLAIIFMCCLCSFGGLIFWYLFGHGF